MKRNEVFTPTTQPTVTYISEHLIDKKLTLNRAIEMGGAVITLSGPSKSGKTVFIETVIGKDNLIQVCGKEFLTRLGHQFWPLKAQHILTNYPPVAH
jgi:ABC-type uncharacterized transport system YnjBCD ATPase subunit